MWQGGDLNPRYPDLQSGAFPSFAYVSNDSTLRHLADDSIPLICSCEKRD